MADGTLGCGRVVGSIGDDSYANEHHDDRSDAVFEEDLMTARVGRKAPDFTAPSYHKGTFAPVKLSDFAGKWVLLCFYPGDFTFV